MTTTKADPIKARTAYLVLGMHRSGTSAVTQLLGLAGADLPRNVMPGDEHNQKGYFEPWKIALLNDRRLRAGGGAWDDIFSFPFHPLDRAEERAWVTEAMALFQEEFGDATYPLLKDPRVTVLAPMWRTVLDDLAVKARVVIPVRHPLAVAGSLGRRNGFAAEKSVLLWSAYMLAAEAYSRDLPRAFVGYDRLLSDWRGEAKRSEAAHGAPLPALDDKAAKAIDSFLTPELRHNASDSGLADLGWAGALAAKVLAWFEAAARDEAPDDAALRQAADELTARRADVGVLVSPAARDLDAARVELVELRAHQDFERGQAAEAAEILKQEIARLQHQLSELRKDGAEAVRRVEQAQRKVELLNAKLAQENLRLTQDLADLHGECAVATVHLDSILAD